MRAPMLSFMLPLWSDAAESDADRADMGRLKSSEEYGLTRAAEYDIL